jgi:two-component system response regulator HydG/two-component system response regulator AtoC
MLRVREAAERAAVTDCNVLITGETGTGKELIAELIHRESARADRPFVCINCAALPEGLIESELFGYERGAFTGANASASGTLESAAGGTVFFDEIGDMSAFAQAKVLRAIESRQIFRLGGRKKISLDFRLVSATHQDLKSLVDQGKFRHDLYYRLSVACIRLPALRERQSDIETLIQHFVNDFNVRFGRNVRGFARNVVNCLCAYEWPGNVRELRNLVEGTFVNSSADLFTEQDLPAHFRILWPALAQTEDTERDRLLDALTATRWNKSLAAERLQWSRMTLYRKMAKYELAGNRRDELAIQRHAAQAM